MRVKACGMSDVGLTRAHNEDCFRIDGRLQVYVVADGMGGHSHGEVASRIAVDSILDFVERTSDTDVTWPKGYDPELDRNANRLRSAIQDAHARVLLAIEQNAALAGMGTTVVSCLMNGDSTVIAHVGDSRCYRFRAGRLELMTQDHTWVNEQVVAGYLSEEQARIHPLKNVVTRALGGESEVAVDVREHPIELGDLFLLCSDGLTTMLGDREIAARMGSDLPLEAICRQLVDDANAKGGLDNVTVVLMQIEESDPV
jgi:protein phosphatase